MLFSVDSEATPFIGRIVNGVVWSTVYRFVWTKPTGTAYLTAINACCSKVRLCWGQGLRTNDTRQDFLGTRHSLLSQIFYLFCQNSISILWRMCVYIYTYPAAHRLYELPLLQIILRVKQFYTNLERCEVLTGYVSLACRPGGDWVNTWRWTARVGSLLFKQEVTTVPSYFHIFLIAFLEEALIGNIVIILWIH